MRRQRSARSIIVAWRQDTKVCTVKHPLWLHILSVQEAVALEGAVHNLMCNVLVVLRKGRTLTRPSHCAPKRSNDKQQWLAGNLTAKEEAQALEELLTDRSFVRCIDGAPRYLCHLIFLILLLLLGSGRPEDRLHGTLPIIDTNTAALLLFFLVVIVLFVLLLFILLIVVVLQRSILPSIFLIGSIAACSTCLSHIILENLAHLCQLPAGLSCRLLLALCGIPVRVLGNAAHDGLKPVGGLLQLRIQARRVLEADGVIQLVVDKAEEDDVKLEEGEHHAVVDVGGEDLGHLVGGDPRDSLPHHLCLEVVASDRYKDFPERVAADYEGLPLQDKPA
mmetsp:Transcript_3131/g.8906  ORF Transcript_3131/g.8906 Transcript_3131/m.8906 type:complete len:335 (-) Transcript_3131:630-1634(-)